jgi:hypothetical protein
MNTRSRSVRLGVAVAVGSSVLALAAAPAFAGKGSNNSSRSGSASLVASPNPVAAGGEYHLTGCSYTAAQVNIVVTEPSATYFFGTPTSNGCINAAFWADNTPGATYGISASQTAGRRQVLMASTTLAVQ